MDLQVLSVSFGHTPLSSCNCSRIYCAITFLILPCINVVSFTPKFFCFRIDILIAHVFRKWSESFFLSNILQTQIRTTWLEYSLTYVYDPTRYIKIPSISTSFRIHNSRKIFPISFLISRKSVVFGTWVQTQDDIYISILYVLNLKCPWAPFSHYLLLP